MGVCHKSFFISKSHGAGARRINSQMISGWTYSLIMAMWSWLENEIKRNMLTVH